MNGTFVREEAEDVESLGLQRDRCFRAGELLGEPMILLAQARQLGVKRGLQDRLETFYGDVTDARVLKPLPLGLDQSALEAVKRWKFKPGTLNGQPVPVIYNLTVIFRLQ